MVGKSISGITLCLALLVTACTGEEKQAHQPLNPNGDSELALLMRDMFDDGLQVKEAVLAGQAPDVRCDYAAIHTAAATEPEKKALPAYDAFARSYEAAIEALENAPPAARAEAYQHMVNSCVQCHQELCPGPIRRINKLFLSESELAALQP